MEASQTVNLYITYVEKEGPFLKVWGQTEKNNSIYVEQFLLGTGPQFDLGAGKLAVENLQPGTLVCAKYKDNKYYRARITNVSFLGQGFVEVSFLDYGNKDIVPCGNIRNLQNFPTSFISIPPLATGFIFAEAHCPGGGEWNDTIFENISKEIKYREVQCTLLIQATQYFLVRLFLGGNDLCAILINRGLMQPISLQAQQAVLLNMSMQRVSVPPPQSAPSTGINTYKACTLEPGCQYPVYVSYVNDGPCHFSVQLKQSEEVLVMLMNDINTITLRLLEDIPIPGTICLARCQEDGNICRAVVTNEVDNQFKVFYVDFGNYEVVPLDALFQIPFKYVLPKVMAIRFSLAGVEKSTVTIEMQCAFKQFVDNRLLHMKVLPAPTRMAIPKCELWDPETKTSALDVVNRAAQNAYPEPVSLNRGFSQPVKVSYVYSCSRFYVQLVSKENELLKLMLDLQESCQTNDPMDPSSVKMGLPCCALFESDQQWYRSQVVEVLGDNVKVRYIDYGNEEEVLGSQLKIIDGEQLTVLRPQAIECCLNGYQNMEEDLERDGFLEELVLEQQFTMKVVEMTNKKALVELFDGANYNIASLLLDKLATAKSQVSPMLVQAGNIIEHRKSVPHQNGPRDQNFRSDRKPGREKNYDRTNDRNDKPWRQDNKDNRNYDKNSNENSEKSSWRQNNRGFSPNNERHNNRDKSHNSSNNSQHWDTTNDKVQESKDDWNTPANDVDFQNNFRENEFGRNKNRFDNDKGGRNSGAPKGGAIKKRNDFRKDGSELSSSGSEKGHMGPRTSSRNDRNDRPKYQNKFDKPRNSSFNSTGGGGDSWNVSAVIPQIDAAPATATYSPYDVVGTESKVIISWFHNPGHFYCQLADAQDQFKTMMNEIQQFYKTRKPEGSVVGAPIIGLFPEDNVLYRAQILETIGNEYKVYYVDFGNVSKITKVWPIEKKFMSLPAQAIVCSLSEVVPPGDTWPDTDNYSKHFERESFTCRFVNKDDEKTYVNLFNGQDDIASLLIQEGLAVSIQETIPDIEIPLLLGQQFRAVIKSINNLSDIIIAIECGLAISCQMHNLETATETFEEALKGLLEQTVIVYVDNVIDDRLEITLYDTEGCKLVILNPDEGAFDSVEALCPPLILRSILTGYVSHADGSSVFIQPTDYAEMVPYLLEQMYAVYEKQKQDLPIIPEEGLIYAVRSQDGNWYRAKVITFDDEQATVTFVDYGNSENVAFSELRELADIFLEICTLCVQVYVNADTGSLLDTEVVATVTYGENGWEGSVELQVPGESSATESEVAEKDNFERTEAKHLQEPVQESQEAVQVTVDTQETAYVPESTEAPEVSDIIEITTTETVIPDSFAENIAVQNGTQVTVSHIDTPNEFYMQLAESLSAIEELQLHLQEEVNDMPVLEFPTAGILCAAPYSADQQWYRAEVLDADIDITTVRFVDYGNTDVIDNKTTEIKTLPPNLLSLAVYGTRCSLKISPTDEEWSTGAIERFETLVNSGSITAEFIDQDEKTNYVELYTDCQNIKDILIQESLGVPAELTVESKSTCFVSHLNSPSEFWIQLENCIDELEWIAEQLSGAEKFVELEDLTPGTLCAALFPDDEMWYRARILSNTVAGLELLFIDYGNSCTSSSLRQLPEDLIVTPPLAQKCSLQKPDGILYWSLQAVNKFNEISADGQTIFTVRKLSTGETAIVQLLLNGEDVASSLLPITEDGFIKDVESLKNIRIEKNGEVLTENYQLETLPGMTWNEESTDKFKALNSQGATLFQIEFIPENTVRLYLNGNDIRINLGGVKTSSLNVSKTNVENDETDKIDDSCCLDESTVCEELPENVEELAKDGSDSDETRNSEENNVDDEKLDDNVAQNILNEEKNLDESVLLNVSESHVCDPEINDQIVSKDDHDNPPETNTFLKTERHESTDNSKNYQIQSSEQDTDLLLENKQQPECNAENNKHESTTDNKSSVNDTKECQDSDATKEALDMASFVHNEIEEIDVGTSKEQAVDDSATLVSNDDIDEMKDQVKSPQKDMPKDSLVQNKEVLEKKEELEPKMECKSTQMVDDKTVTSPTKESENNSLDETNENREVVSSLHEEIEEACIDSDRKQCVNESAMFVVSNDDVGKIKDQDKLPQKDLTQDSLIQDKEKLTLKEVLEKQESTQIDNNKTVTSPKKGSESKSLADATESPEITSFLHKDIEEANIDSNKNDSATSIVSSDHIDKVIDQDKSPQNSLIQNKDELDIKEVLEKEEELDLKEKSESTVDENTRTFSKKESKDKPLGDTNESLAVAFLLHQEIEKALDKKDEQINSRPSSSCSSRLKDVDHIIPGTTSRPHTPVDENLAVDAPNSESEGLGCSEVATILKDLVDDALDKQDDDEVKSRSQSRNSGKMCFDERIVPGAVSRPHSPLEEDIKEC